MYLSQATRRIDRVAVKIDAMAEADPIQVIRLDEVFKGMITRSRNPAAAALAIHPDMRYYYRDQKTF